jgi:hypothetical protein
MTVSSALLNSVGYTGDGELRKRIRMATVVAALAVQGEAANTQTPAGLTKRAALASRVLATAGNGTTTDNIDQAFVWAVMANGLISPTSPDADIQFTVNSVFSDLAGLTAAETL